MNREQFGSGGARCSMSDFNDFMLDGVICQSCGQFVGDPTGYPRSCGSCEKLEVAEDPEPNEWNIDTDEIAHAEELHHAGELDHTRELDYTEELDDDLPF